MTHPITPPPELVQQWEEDWYHSKVKHVELLPYIAAQSAQYGADQELEACCEWLAKPEVELTGKGPNDLRAARRPKPPSLKEQALELARPAGTEGAHVTFGPEELALIRRALEQIDD